MNHVVKGEEMIDKINILHSHNYELGVKSILSIIEFCINKIREENDTVELENIKFNQGQLSQLKQLKFYILKGTSSQSSK